MLGRNWHNRVKLRHLRTVLAIVDCGGITAAAAQLSVSQAAISKALAEVEEALALKLFQRKGRFLAVTPAGERFVEAARKISVQINNLGEELEQMTRGGSGILRIGLQAVTAREALVGAVARLGARQPAARFQLRDGHLEELAADLEAGRLDVIFGRLVPAITARFRHLPLLHTEASAVVATPGHPILALPAPRWPDLLAYPWVLPLPETPLRRHFDAVVAAQLVGRITCTFETTSLESMQVLLRKAPLLGLVPLRAAERWQAEGLVVPLALRIEPQSEPLGLAWTGSEAEQPLLRLLRAELVADTAGSALKWRGPVSELG